MSLLRSTSRWGRRAAAVLSLVCATAGAQHGGSEAGSASWEEQFSEYELGLIHEHQPQGAELEPRPAGKLIEEIRIVRLAPFVESDPVPTVVNLVHSTTLERVVRSELLFSEGQRYRQALVEQTARNLREMAQLSVVLIVAFQGSSDERVRLLVLTKDVWSLRLNWAVQMEGDRLNLLLVNPSEENVAGTHLSVGGLFMLERDRQAFGLIARHPRILGTRISLLGSANLIVNRDSGVYEGSFGQFAAAQPLYSRDAEFGWVSGVLWYDELARSYRGGTVLRYDSSLTPVDDAIPFEHRSATFGSTYEATRSFGESRKFDLSLGFEALRQETAPLPPAGVDEAAFSEFVREQLPPDRQRFGPTLQLRAHEQRYYQAYGLETLELQEDVQLGYDFIARLYPSSTAFASSRDLLGLFGGVSYTQELGGALLRAMASGRLELSTPERSDAEASASLRLTSPRGVLGRFHYDAVLRHRFANFSNRRSSLGGDGRLRGYRSGELRGADAFAHNLEWRSTALEGLSAHWAVTAFYDSGAAADRFGELKLLHSVGAGVRLLLPQFDRAVFRFDWGIPVDRGGLQVPGGVFLSFGQAFEMPQLRPPSLAESLSL